MEKTHSIMLSWPALMSKEFASHYLSLDNRTFELLTSQYSLFPVIVSDNENRWRKTDLDKLIRKLPEDIAFTSSASDKRELYLEKSSLDELAIKIGNQLRNAEANKTSSLVSIDETAGFLGVGRSTVYRLIENDRLVKRKIGRRTLITRDSVNLLLDQ